MYQRKKPIDQARERTERSDAPFTDARETLRQEDAELEQEGAHTPPHSERLSEAERPARQEEAAAHRLDQIGKERSNPDQ